MMMFINWLKRPHFWQTSCLTQLKYVNDVTVRTHVRLMFIASVVQLLRILLAWY